MLEMCFSGVASSPSLYRSGSTDIITMVCSTASARVAFTSHTVGLWISVWRGYCTVTAHDLAVQRV